MYSKEEARFIRKKFWTAFGQYMKIHSASTGENINWVNYKTGIKDLYFKTDVDNKSAVVSIEIHLKDKGLRNLMFQQFKEFQPLFESYFDERWNWFPEVYDRQGKLIGKIELKLENKNIFRESDWPEIITFLKQNLIRLDEFWKDVKDTFEIFK